MNANDRVKAIRQANKMNQKEFADMLGMTQSNVSIMERTGNTVTEQNIKAICTTFNVREEWLREGKGEMFLSSKETLINRLKNELHLNDTEIAILNIYAELPQEDRDSIIKFAQRASTLFIAAQSAPPAEEPYTEEELAIYEKVRAAKEKERGMSSGSTIGESA